MKHLEKLVLESSGVGVVEGDDLARLRDMAKFLAEYERANVIGTRDVGEILSEHIADSLGCLQYRPIFEAAKVVDIGSGGGLPALPLSVLLRSATFTLVESNGKKVTFLEQVIASLEIGNARVVRQRAEEFGSGVQNRGGFDLATARALARLDIVAEYCIPLLKVGGVLVAMKAHISNEERSCGEKAAKILGAEVEEIRPMMRSSLQESKERNLVIIRKVRETPARYPRKTGVPGKNPLGD